MRSRTATIAASLATAAAFTYLAFFLLGPVYGSCRTGVRPGETPVVEACRQVGWLEAQFGSAPPDARSLVFLTLWTLAPGVALVGVKLRERGGTFGAALVLSGLLVDLSSVISIGGGFIYALLCGPLLLIALVATLRASGTRPAGAAQT